MPVILNTEKRLAIQAWKEAHKQGVLELELQTQRNKTRTRFLLYQVRNLVEQGKIDDLELKIACQSCIIRQEGTKLTIESADQSEVTGLLKGFLGEQDHEAIVGALPSEAELLASQAKMLEVLGEKTTKEKVFEPRAPALPPKRTPYY